MLDIRTDKVMQVVVDVSERTQYIFDPDEVSQIVQHTIRKCERNHKDAVYFYILLENELEDYLMIAYINAIGEENRRRKLAVAAGKEARAMCDVCRQAPCHPRCPNAPEPTAVYTCKICGEAIRVGEEFYEMEGEYYHEECFEDNAVKILVDEYGAMAGTAEEGARW